MVYSLEGAGSSTRQGLFSSGMASDEQFEDLTDQTVVQLDSGLVEPDIQFRSSLSISYAPSLGRTDFSEPFPHVVTGLQCQCSRWFSMEQLAVRHPETDLGR